MTEWGSDRRINSRIWNPLLTVTLANHVSLKTLTSSQLTIRYGNSGCTLEQLHLRLQLLQALFPISYGRIWFESFQNSIGSPSERGSWRWIFPICYQIEFCIKFCIIRAIASANSASMSFKASNYISTSNQHPTETKAN